MLAKGKNWLKRLFQKLIDQGQKLDYWQWLFSLAGMVAIRTLIINLEQGLPDKSANFLVAFFLQDLFFFFFTLSLLWLWLAFILQVRVKELIGVISWGNWLVILPLLIDWIFAGKIYWSFYLLSPLRELWLQYSTFFGHLPPAVVYFGTRISTALAIIFVALFVYLRSEKAWKGLLSAPVVYSIFFFLASLPSWIAFVFYLLSGKNIGSVTIADIAVAIVAPVKVWGIDFQPMSSAIMFKLNLVFVSLAVVLIGLFARAWNGRSAVGKRISKELWISALVLIGGFLLGTGMYPENVANSGFYAWFALLALVFSQIFSWEGDRGLIGPEVGSRQKNTMVAQWALPAIALTALGAKFLLLWLSYKAMWFIISSYFKPGGSFFASNLLKAAGLILNFALGFMLVSQNQTLELFPWGPASWLAIGISFLIFSDPHGWSVDVAPDQMKRIVFESFIFAFFLISPAIFGDPSIFSWAMIFGGASFWALERKSVRKWFFLRALFLIFLLLVLLVR